MSPELAAQQPVHTSWRRARLDSIIGGGVEGNEELTTITGAILLVTLAVLGITILRIGELMWTHLFVGLLLIGPVVLKLASTGYRFARYYTGNLVYRRKGPPQPLLRLLAPVVVMTTVVVFASGVVLLFIGPADRGDWVLIHKASFIAWLGATAIHVLGHLPHMPRSLRATHRARSHLPGMQTGSAGRWLGVAGALVGGLVLAVSLIPDYSIWTAHTAVLHHHS